jgi:BirA family biotin operon repressor/biotin-[acetyl-CoA-carboxylase] ligase
MIEVPDWTIEYFKTLDSTMHVAAQRPPHTAVVADEQTAGIGRHGHTWYSKRNAGLYVSVVLPAAAVPVITLAMGLATTEAIAQTTGLVCDIRWPNDLLLDGRKTAGILVQASGKKLVAGIGVNVNHKAFPAPLDEEATSLRLAAGREFAREELLEHLLPAVDYYAALPTAEVLDIFAQASSYVRGRRVTVDGVAGITAGLDESGFLRLQRDDGSVSLVLAGGVRATGA